MLPEGSKRASVTLGFLFPSSVAAAQGFDQLVQPYLYRWDLAVREDNEISLNQQRASEVLAPRRPCATLCLRACPPRSSAPFWGGAGVAGQPRSRRVHSRRIVSDRIFFILSAAVTRTSQSPHHRPGPYHPLEFAVHRFDNMVLDAVLAGEAAESQQAAERQQAGRQAVRRHRVAPRTRSPACRLPARVGGGSV